MPKIKNLTPKLKVKTLEQELQFPDLLRDQTVQSLGGLMAGSRELSHGKIKIQGVDERMLFGDVTDFGTGVGVYVGKDPSDDLYKFRAGDPAGTQLYWDGSTLSIVGFLEDGEAAADINANVTTVDGGKITANSVTATQISAGTITTTEIAANTITASNIASNTITASEIAANTITASEIAANTITASEIAANTITASEIAANAITTSELAANSVTATEINVANLSSINANIGSITSGNIDGVTVTGGTVRTSSGSDRIQMNGSNNRLEFVKSGSIDAYLYPIANGIGVATGLVYALGGVTTNATQTPPSADGIYTSVLELGSTGIVMNTRSSAPSDAWALYMYSSGGSYGLKTRMSSSNWSVDQTSGL